MEKTKNGFVVPFGEKFSYGLGMLGTNLSFGLVASYILIYFTDVYRIAPAIVGVLFLVARLWDAVNDPMMGVIADKTRTRWGKFRPYILLSGVLLPVFTYLLFASPELSQTGKVVYAFIIYIAWGMAYTVSDIPKWSIVSVMTNVKQERVGIISIAKVLGMVGTVGINIAVIPLVQALGGDDTVVGYRNTALVVAVAVFLATLLIFFTAKERITPQERKPSLKESLGAIVKNKPLLMLLASLLIVTAVMMIGQSLQIHYITYNLGGTHLVPIITAATILPMLVGASFTGLFTKKLGAKRTFVVSIAGIVLRGLLMFFIGYTRLPLLVAVWALGNFFFGLFNVVNVAMLTDTIDYDERKTGVRNEGVIFSTQTFIVKLSGALGGSMAALALAAIGYVDNVEQSLSTLGWLHNFMTIVPAAVALLAFIPVMFYSLDTEKKE